MLDHNLNPIILEVELFWDRLIIHPVLPPIRPWINILRRILLMIRSICWGSIRSGSMRWRRRGMRRLRRGCWLGRERNSLWRRKYQLFSIMRDWEISMRVSIWEGLERFLWNRRSSFRIIENFMILLRNYTSVKIGYLGYLLILVVIITFLFSRILRNHPGSERIRGKKVWWLLKKNKKGRWCDRLTLGR